jgi:hypothetical protein
MILIDVLSLRHTALLGVDVTMHVIHDYLIPRRRYLRKMTMKTYLEAGNSIYEHEDDGEEVDEEVDEEEDEEDEDEDESASVDTTFVSGVCECFV